MRATQPGVLRACARVCMYARACQCVKCVSVHVYVYVCVRVFARAYVFMCVSKCLCV